MPLENPAARVVVPDTRAGLSPWPIIVPATCVACPLITTAPASIVKTWWNPGGLASRSLWPFHIFPPSHSPIVIPAPVSPAA